MLVSLATCAALLAVIPSTLGANIDVTVGGPGILKFDPPSVDAKVGDVVIFHFKQKNHTATQSTLANPCQRAPGGFDSGFVPVPDSNTDGPFPEAQFTVKDTKPVWVYCAQGNHCESGMVFAINPGDKLTDFQNNAKSAAPSSASTTASAATPTSSSSSTTSTDHKVVVGGPGQLVYNPSSIQAQPGDTVTFEFRQKNHTVTQSTFAAPCRALTLTSTTGQVGFDSGFQPVADGATTFPTYTIQINDTKPVWAYCRQATHCGSGMVFAVNVDASSGNTFDAFQAKAMQLNGTSSGSGGYGSSGTSGASPSIRNGASIVSAVIALAFAMVF